MFAYDPPAVAAPATPDDQSDVIEIVGHRASQALKIDRRTYSVQQTPHSQQKDAIQLLRGLPAVNVSPDEEISLLGSADVRIFVDGRPYQGDAKQYLRTLHGGDIERIEVITNPSAQYSAEGSAGIINFVLRKKQNDGTSGTAVAEASNPSYFTANGTLKHKHGKWTYELVANARAGTNSRSSYHKLRAVEATEGGTPTINTEDGRGHSREEEADLSAKVTYQLDSRTSLSANLRGAIARPINSVDAEFAGVTPDFQSFSDRRRKTDRAPFFGGDFTLDHKGRKEGETLTADVKMFDVPAERGRTTERFSNGGGLSLRQNNRFKFGGGQIDWQHPMGKGEILSVGGNWDYQDEAQHYSFVELGGGGSPGSSSTDEYSAVTNTLAVYATFQQPIGIWTLMPGIRGEWNTRHVASPSLPDVSIHRMNLFPTLHIEHPLTKTLDLTLSYSKRIDRAGPDMLRPYRAVEDVFTSGQGNPHLADQSTDAYEINLHYHRKKIDAGVIIYDRETSHLWSTDYTAIEGVNVYTWINAGHRSDRGAEFDISTPLVAHVKANASVNLFDKRSPIDVVSHRRIESSFHYTTDMTVQWTAPDRGGVAGDVAQFEWRYYSPTSGFQITDSARNELSLSCTHSFSRTVSMTGLIDYWNHFSHRLVAPLVQEYYAERNPVEFKLKLLKTFGKP